MKDNSHENEEKESRITSQPMRNEPNSPSLDVIIEAIAKNVEPIRLLISELADKWLKIKESEFEFNKKMVESELTFNKKMVDTVVIIVVIIIISASVLTYTDKIEGSTFTFLLGLILGYMLTFVKEITAPKG
jgi:uncharacterized membrane protein